MTDLMAHLEAATEGSRKLDEAIAFSLYPDLRRDGDRFYIDDIQVYVEDYTTSIDTALTLIPTNCYPTMLTWNSMGGSTGYCKMKIRGPFEKHDWHSDVHGKARTPALALCIAALKAKEEE